MDFGELVLQSENLVRNLDQDNLPHVSKNIDHLRQQKEKYICTKVVQNDVKAARLLGNKVGAELSSKLSKTLETIETYSVKERLAIMVTDDIPGFLKQQRESGILLGMQLSKDCTIREGYKDVASARTTWWGSERNKMCEIMLNADKLPNLVLSTRNIKPDPIEPNNNYVLDNFTHEEIEYLKQTNHYIDNIINENYTESIEKTLLFPMQSSKISELREIYSLANNYCNISDAHAYKSAIENRQHDSDMCNDLIRSSINHLESEFLLYIKQYISPVNDCKTEKESLRIFIGVFVKSLLLKDDFTDLEDGQVDGIPIWPLVFTAFRCGLYDVALDVLKNAGGHISDFNIVINQYIQDGYLPSDLTKKIANEYKRSVKSSGDVFKRFMYCLLSDCDIDDNHTSILTTIDDFIWAKLWYAKRVNSLLRSSNSKKLQAGDTAATESSISTQLSIKHFNKSADMGSLKHLQKVILDDYGESYFQANENPIAYARILLLCQLFENAVAFLARFESTICHGIHLGIVLWTKSLLLVTNDIGSPILSTNEQEITSSTNVSNNLLHANLGRLVSMYVYKFQNQYPSEAIDLFYLLRTLKTPVIHITNTITSSLSITAEDLLDAEEQNNLPLESVFVRLVSELAVSSQWSDKNMGDDFDESNRMLQVLFGKYGSETKGLLQSKGLTSDIPVLLRGIAARLVALDKTEAASEALELSGQIPEAADLLSRCLANISAGSCSPASKSVSPHILKLQSRATELIHTYQSDFPDKIHLLQRVLAASLLLIGSDTDQKDPIKLLDQTELLPPSSDMVVPYTQQFANSAPILKSLLAPLLLCAARVLREVGSLNSSSRDPIISNKIRTRAAALVIFAGQLPYRFPGEIYSCLSQLEIAVN